MRNEIIDKKSGWSLQDIAIFKKELLEDKENAKNYGFTDNEINYIINFNK